MYSAVVCYCTPYSVRTYIQVEDWRGEAMLFVHMSQDQGIFQSFRSRVGLSLESAFIKSTFDVESVSIDKLASHVGPLVARTDRS